MTNTQQPQECYEKSLDINEGRSDAWLQLSLEGGGQVQGCFYSKDQCQQKAEAWEERPPKNVNQCSKEVFFGRCLEENMSHDNYR